MSSAGHRVTKKSEVVARGIADELYAQQISSGSVLDIGVEEDLLKRLGVSRGTLREALRLLEVLGVAESRVGRSGGVVVRRPSAEHFAQIVTFYLQFSGCTFRQMIEVYEELWPISLRMAATRASDQDIENIRKAVDTLESLPIERQVRFVANIEGIYHGFHDNPLWALLAQSLHALIRAHQEEILVPPAEWPNLLRTVRRLADAVCSHDAPKAERLARAQGRAWREVAEENQRALLDSPIVWTTDQEIFAGRASQ